MVVEKVRIRPNRLRWLRENRSHLTLEEMATLTGFDMSTVSRHESGDRQLSESAVATYARIYKVPSWQIFLDPAELEEKKAVAS